ncbi:Polyprotein [Phytophthora palmivora]|uniref:Polyprotein n=1 Tax=Phytophthora palmivora TaxID=4796 RepID=A0A2P4XVC1_9STRA|nr:Polyprotein [Phytophthora palmivora]
MFRIKNELKELGSPLSDLQMVDLLLRSLPQQVCYNELRRKVIFSSDMSKYTPDLVRELILTAEVRNKDWRKNAFGSSQGKKKQGNALTGLKGKASGDRFKKKTSGDGSKKTSKSDITCSNCGAKGHYKSGCPDLEEKPSAEMKASAKMARSGEKPVKKIPSEQMM